MRVRELINRYPENKILTLKIGGKYSSIENLPKTYPSRTPRANRRAGAELNFPLNSGLETSIHTIK